MRRVITVAWLLCNLLVFGGIFISFFLSGTAPLFDYFSLFPQSIYPSLLFLLFIIGYFLLRTPRWILVFPIVGMILSLIWLLDIVFIHFPVSSPDSSRIIRVVSWNTGVWDATREELFFAEMKKRNADVYLLQEVIFANNTGLKERLLEEFPAFFVSYGGEYLTISRFPILKNEFLLSKGYSRHEIEIKGKLVTFYNVHLRVPIYGDAVKRDNKYDFYLRKGQFSDLQRDLHQEHGSYFLGGDFNSTRNYSFMRILENQLVMNQPEGILLFPKTFHSLLPMIRIDYQFTNKTNQFVKYERFGGTISDHFGLYGEFYDNN
ncbi:MAG: hypothetical protein M3Q44_04235 [bacterium]|nr:hypothetical protein [bacterium]